MDGVELHGSAMDSSGRERVTHPRLEPRRNRPFLQVISPDDRVRVLRRTRLFHRLLLKCGGVTQLPEGKLGLASEVDPLGQEETEAEARGDVELIPELVPAGIGGRAAGKCYSGARGQEWREPVPGFAASQVELKVQVGKRDRLIYRAAAAVGQRYERIDDKTLQAAVRDAQTIRCCDTRTASATWACWSPAACSG